MEIELKLTLKFYSKCVPKSLYFFRTYFLQVLSYLVIVDSIVRIGSYVKKGCYYIYAQRLLPPDV